MLPDLDEIGMPAYDLLDLNYFRQSSKLWDGMSVMWSRGCSFHCICCASNVVHGRKVREKSNARILEELSEIQRMGFGTVTIYDDLFAARRAKFLELVDGLGKAGFLGKLRFRLPSSLSVSVLDEAVIDAIERMGIEYYRVAVESGSSYTQRHIIKKNVNLEKCRRVLRYMRTKSIPVEANFILGFPGETRELMQETIDFIESIDVDWILINCALPLPGTQMFYQYVDMGVIDEDKYDWDLNRPALRSFDTPEIGGAALAQLVYDVNINRNFFHNTNITHGRYQRAIDYFNMMVCERYPFHVVGLYCRGVAYDRMGQKAAAAADFTACVARIRADVQARRMYQRYGGLMGGLAPYFGPNENYRTADGHAESVRVLPTSRGD